MALALFDLDNTLLAGDSDYLWGCFLVEQGIVDGPTYEAENKKFYEDYDRGILDIDAYLNFQLAVLARFDLPTLHHWRARFMTEKVEPIIAPGTPDLLHLHRQRRDTLIIITATNRFVTEPIAQRLGVEHLLATEVELDGHRFTGRARGIPCFREGKVTRLRQWMEEHQETLEDSWFYSDSLNDIPLLEQVSHPRVVDPTPRFHAMAQERGWVTMTLRGTASVEAPGPP
ncbi:MAG: HAD family hydrolase [Magnetococcales bacterium]|nr:HAD family hydrolase [Magnetococcales bacterium]MBF0150504.1 HAD family hydrolase [Magnetococcales bacterium]MBF0172962.1 HAD family hydrolase [Magnetococcales bacterium]MBF0348362.1 HAD family hydrolase [Magnetococcales bacterium]MBF0631411.1 HAD family hydrolase [Magnetococcales bacterium]